MKIALVASAYLVAGIALPASATAATLHQLSSVQVVGNVRFEYQLQTALKLGVGRVRVAAFWSAVERPRGRYIWRSTDARIKAVLKAGLVPIIVLFGPNDGYPSPDGSKSAPPSEGEALEGFARFAGATAARYGAGQPATPVLYEIWNEPNTRTFWKRRPDPEGYARMAESACKAIKAVRPQAQVLAFGMEGWPVKAPYRVAAYNIDIYQEWANRAATPGLMGCADGISFHPYLPRPEQVLRDEPRLQNYLSRIWQRSKPPLLANTEWGYAIDTRRGVDASMQAALDLRALLIGTGLGRVTNIYQSVDTGNDATKPDLTYGLAGADGHFKPSGLALRRTLVAIGDYEIDGVVQVAGMPGLYRFTAHRGDVKAQIMWSDKASVQAAISADVNAMDLVTGSPVEQKDGSIAIGTSPVLIMNT